MRSALFDALTPKQARIASILKIYGKEKLNLIITCRKYFHLEDILNLYNVEYICIGKYGENLKDKLVFGLERQMKLVDIAEGVDGVVSFPSPDAVRVAFGLGKRIVVLNDTPHAAHVNYLTLPLADMLIAPSAIPPESWRPYCPKRIAMFDGVFEYMWTSRHKPNIDAIKRLGLAPGEYVVFRPEEAKAAYYRWDSVALRNKLVEHIKSLGYKVVNVPRYGDQVIPGEINLVNAVDHLDLAYYAAAVVTGGLTMATEAALLGVPAVSFFPSDLYIDKFLRDKGAPLYRCNGLDQCLSAVKLALSEGRRGGVKLEDPLPVILEAVESL
nr:MAG: hypothetical protein TU35_01430 [Thermoproteus sp. AZ2]